MLDSFAEQRSQRLLKQRNTLTIIAGAELIAITLLIAGLSARPREIVLTPTISRPLTISTSGISDDYLELVTRDTALMLLNRSPEALDYWMEQILALAHPDAYGKLKGELVRIVTEQKGSDIAQAFVIAKMTVDAENLTSEVEGTLKTYVGAQVISTQKRRFKFAWDYTGLKLSLTGFVPVLEKKEPSQ